MARADVLARGDRIAEIGERIAAPPAALIVAGAGKTLRPGLIDGQAPVGNQQQLAAAAAFVAACKAEGSDHLEIIDGPRNPRCRSIDRATMAALVAAAHDQDLLAVAHVETQDEAREAREAGGDGLAHLVLGSAPRPASAAPAASRRAFVIPTLSVLRVIGGAGPGKERAADPALEPYLTSADAGALASSFGPIRPGAEAQVAFTAVAQLAAAGVPILAGTDAPDPGTRHGASIHGETDQSVGGSSRVALSVIRPGADGGEGALRIAGDVAAATSRWAGALFTPGSQPMAPVDLSSKRQRAFRARGDGRRYVALLFVKCRDYQPIARPVAVGRGWKEIRLALASFGRIDGRDRSGVFIGAAEPGRFALEIDDVAFAP